VLEFGDRIVHMEDGRIMPDRREAEIPKIPPHTIPRGANVLSAPLEA